MPNVVGSPWMPCERPMHNVSLCSMLRFFRAARSLSRSAMMRSAAWVSMTANDVSITSELVMPWWT